MSNYPPPPASPDELAGHFADLFHDLRELMLRLPGSPADARIARRLAEELADGAAMIAACPGRPAHLPGHTRAAVEAVVTAVEEEQDFGGWLARVLCYAAARAGSIDALTARRPESWEAEHVRALAEGTAPAALDGFQDTDTDTDVAR